ncbi:hypothetical protein BC835DRAFT_1314516 [Cytidiella melzeri]|nr:hypothetical protein BC835DRAFT_1314516 [Cytidiella melzeri]
MMLAVDYLILFVLGVYYLLQSAEDWSGIVDSDLRCRERTIHGERKAERFIFCEPPTLTLDSPSDALQNPLPSSHRSPRSFSDSDHHHYKDRTCTEQTFPTRCARHVHF